MSTRKNWTREQLIVALSLYCQIPFGRLHADNPEIIKYSKLLGRTPSALAMKLSNLASLDPAITSSGRKGLQGASAFDRHMWDEMTNDWDKFASEAEQVMSRLDNDEINAGINPANHEQNHTSHKPADYSGQNKSIQTSARVGQSFFRKSVLSAYNNQCCITGLSLPKLLVASHIIPWSQDEANRLNPHNGLALSMLHDKAFDLGLITIQDNMTVRVSKHIAATSDTYFENSIRYFDGKEIFLPEKFQPKLEFLEFHRNHIFESWL